MAHASQSEVDVEEKSCPLAAITDVGRLEGTFALTYPVRTSEMRTVARPKALADVEVTVWLHIISLPQAQMLCRVFSLRLPLVSARDTTVRRSRNRLDTEHLLALVPLAVDVDTRHCHADRSIRGVTEAAARALEEEGAGWMSAGVILSVRADEGLVCGEGHLALSLFNG